MYIVRVIEVISTFEAKSQWLQNKGGMRKEVFLTDTGIGSMETYMTGARAQKADHYGHKTVSTEKRQVITQRF